MASPAYAHHEDTALGPVVPAVPTSGAPVDDGVFSAPFEEPRIGNVTTQDRCVVDSDGVTRCKPAAGSVSVLPNGRIVYWNALEGTERIERSLITDYGSVALNDQSRLLNLATNPPTWTVPSPSDAGANPGGYGNPLFPGGNGEPNNDGALFCSDHTFLPDGRVMATGGTAYYQDPEIADTGIGVVELEGLRATRIYDPATNRWSQTGSMNVGRWYPSLVSLGNGREFVASGVEKLVKPVYPDHLEDSFTNVRKTETYDPGTGKWTDNGAAGERSLPLFARLHLLPNGHVYYNAAGQSFNPLGQSYDEALWNVAASYDPATRSWKDLGIPGLEGGTLANLADLDFGQPLADLAKLGIPGGGKSLTIPGFRGSTFSVMLPLEPDLLGRYTKASFLTAGGVVNPPSPGSYLSTSDARITTVDTDRGDAIQTKPTGDLSRPRWYPSGVLLPTGEVMAFSGADRDEVATPGLELPVQQAELWNPSTGDWRPVASGHRPRTYHNSAALLPGRAHPDRRARPDHDALPVPHQRAGLLAQRARPELRALQPALPVPGRAAADHLGPVDARLRRHDADHRRPAGERDRQRGAGPQPDADARHRRRPAQRRAARGRPARQPADGRDASERQRGPARPVHAVREPQDRQGPGAVGLQAAGPALGETLRAQFLERGRRLLELEPHALQHGPGLRELHVRVLHDLDAVAPGIAEVEAAAAEQLDACLLGQLADALPVVDDEPEVARRVGRLRAALVEHEELVAQVEEDHRAGAAAQLELEQAGVERERCLDVVDFQDDVVDTDHPRLVAHAIEATGSRTARCGRAVSAGRAWLGSLHG